MFKLMLFCLVKGWSTCCSENHQKCGKIQRGCPAGDQRPGKNQWKGSWE